MTVDGNKRRRSLREYRVYLRPTLDESGPFEEVGIGYTYKSPNIYRPGDIVYVKAYSSRHPENTNEKFAKGDLKEVLREAVIVYGRLWKPSRYCKDPNSGKRIQGLIKRNGYWFKQRTELNNEILRKDYWKIITSDIHDWVDIKSKLFAYSKTAGEGVNYEKKI